MATAHSTTASEVPLVHAVNVLKSFHGNQVLKGIDMDVHRGEVVCLLGPSGSGKTTFLRCINQLETIDGGRIWVDGDLMGYDDRGGTLYRLNNKRIAAQRRDIGVLLLTKLAIIRLFPHFMGALPALGLGLLINTVILGSLSLPYALQAHNISGDTLSPQNLERVRDVLAGLPLPEDVDAAALATPERLADGRDVLTRKCTVCHDMRTILAKPRSGPGWFNVVVRMAEKPLIMGDALDDRDIPLATAYLIAITPDMQQSAKVRMKAMKDQAERVAEVAEMPADTAASSEAAAPAALDLTKAEALYKARCTQCHELDEIKEHGGDDEAGWAKIVKRMVEDEGAELGEDEARTIVRFLAATYKKSA